MMNEIDRIRDRDSGFRYGCTKCYHPPHFSTKKQLKEHIEEFHRGPSFAMDLSDFQNGGDILE